MLARLLSLFMALMTLGADTLAEYENAMNLGGYLFLVNRDYAITADYEPDDLVMPDVRRVNDAAMMRRDAAAALEDMFSAAKSEGLNLVAVSGYRSYQTQKNIFARKVNSVGRKRALLYVAPPGCSEHQLGLAMDLATPQSTGLTSAFARTKEGKWVAEHCWEYGFIIRYKEEWQEITGYAWEPWHVRYVGKEHAERITRLDIPLEYYIAQLSDARFASLREEGIN